MSVLEASHHVVYHGEEVLAKEYYDVYYREYDKYSGSAVSLNEVVQKHDTVNKRQPFCLYRQNKERQKLFVREEYCECKEEAQVKIIVGGIA